MKTLNEKWWISQLTFKTWGLTKEDFSYLCPFFWLTLFTLAILPISLLLILIRYIGKIIARNATEKAKALKAWSETYYRWITNDEDAMNHFLETFYKDKTSQTYKFFEMYLIHFDIELYYKCEGILRNYNMSLYIEKDQKAIIRKNKINKIVKFTKPISKVALYGLAILSIYGLGYLFNIVIDYLLSLPKSSWLAFFKKAGEITFWVMIGILLVIGIVKSSNKENGVINKMGNFFYRIGSSILSFISVFYEENCPPIKWK